MHVAVGSLCTVHDHFTSDPKKKKNYKNQKTKLPVQRKKKNQRITQLQPRRSVSPFSTILLPPSPRLSIPLLWHCSRRIILPIDGTFILDLFLLMASSGLADNTTPNVGQDYPTKTKKREKRHSRFQKKKNYIYM